MNLKLIGYSALAIIVVVLILIALGTTNVSAANIQNLCSAYITISTAIIAVIFAAMAIVQSSGKPVEHLFSQVNVPIQLSLMALFLSIWADFFTIFTDDYLVYVKTLFGIASIFTFATIFSIFIMIEKMQPPKD